MNDNGFDLVRFEKGGVDAVIAGMEVVRCFHLRDKLIGEASIKKADDTFLTVADRECGEMLRSYVRHYFPGVRSDIEDVGKSADESKVTLYVDPVDGTLPFTVGLPTSTVILGAYDTEAKKVLACCIGEPASGRLWWSNPDGQCYGATWDFTLKHLRNERQFTVWPGDLSANTAVLLDHPQGFKRSGRQILSNEQAGQLMVSLAQYRLLMTGSNGLHQAVLAQGNDKMAGAITSAIGGPQDVCGVRLVLNAGGVAKAFCVTDDRKLVEVSSEAIEHYDILVLGNTPATVERLSKHVLDLF